MKYECPHCKEKTITLRQKAFAGTLTSRGAECEKCKRRCVNGKDSTIFRLVTSLAVLLFITYMICKYILPFSRFSFQMILSVISFTVQKSLCLKNFYLQLFYTVFQLKSYVLQKRQKKDAPRMGCVVTEILVN